MLCVKFRVLSCLSCQLESFKHRKRFRRRFVIVSAPGNAMQRILKVTDSLIKCYRDYVAGNDISKSQDWIINRYAYGDELGLKPTVLKKSLKVFAPYHSSY